tara:strand:- start:7801 stop:8055 length:255 start_codon:yes stop_codon:yes gene_type:complete
MFKTFLASLFIVSVIVACGSDSKSSAPAVNTAEKACMDKHRWDTTAVNTSRLVVEMHFHKKGQGELARRVSDYDAVKMVYCSDK